MIADVFAVLALLTLFLAPTPRRGPRLSGPVREVEAN